MLVGRESKNNNGELEVEEKQEEEGEHMRENRKYERESTNIHILPKYQNIWHLTEHSR